MIEFKNISKQYNEKTVLKKCNLEIQEGEFFVLVGPSGSGKTTTLKMLNRLIEPTDGDIYFNDKRLIDYDLKELRLTIGYVLQQIALFPNLTVAENIELIPEMKKWKKEQRRERAKELLAKVNLSPETYLDRKPAELSGGEQQRIGILRAIAAKPDIILMDEPFSALDPISREQLQLLIKNLHKELSSTIVFVTHDMNEAMLLGDRICVMREGEVLQVATPEEIRLHPKNEFVAQFFKNEQGSFEQETVQSLVNAKLLTPITNKQARTIASDDKLSEVIQWVYEEACVNVMAQNQLVGEINDHVLISYLAAKTGKNGGKK